MAAHGGFPLCRDIRNVDNDIRRASKVRGNVVKKQAPDLVRSKRTQFRQPAIACESARVASHTRYRDMIGMLILPRIRGQHDVGPFSANLCGRSEEHTSELQSRFDL